MLSSLSEGVRQYLLITFNYWAFTLTDGALRMLVVLHFHQLGYSPLEVAMLFLFYEIFGVITNLVGGWLGAHIGLNATMNAGLLLQVAALSMLLVPQDLLTVAWVMAAQALSGIAKDLNKMSAKSAIKTLVPANAQGTLYKWVAILTGSKNALKGVGFFLGGMMLSLWGFREAIGLMVAMLAVVWVFSILHLKKSLFAARDVWFVVALPVYLTSAMGWDHWAVGAFLASWVIGYGFFQSVAPRFTGSAGGRVPDGITAFRWAAVLSLAPAAIALAMALGVGADASLLVGLMVFGILFAVNSALHSFLIVSYAREEGVSLDVGFYYMANAMGRLLGTVLSGWVYQTWGIGSCLWISSVLIALSALVALSLPRTGAATTV